MGKIYSLRGATTVDANTAENITERSVELVAALVEKIDFTCSRAVNLFITTTADLTAFYPARAVRESGLLDGCPLFSALEPSIDGALGKCIRVMLTIETDAADFVPKHVYLRGAAVLRPDLAK